VKIRVVVLVLGCLIPSLLTAQRLTTETIYFGAMGGIATLSGDANAVITSSSASTSSYDPSNGGAAGAFIGAHIFDYFSFQADYVWNRNDAVLVGNWRLLKKHREMLRSWETCTSRCPVFPPLSHNWIAPSPCCTVSGIRRALMPSQRLQRPTPAAPWLGSARLRGSALEEPEKQSRFQ